MNSPQLVEFTLEPAITLEQARHLWEHTGSARAEDRWELNHFPYAGVVFEVCPGGGRIYTLVDPTSHFVMTTDPWEGTAQPTSSFVRAELVQRARMLAARSVMRQRKLGAFFTLEPVVLAPTVLKPNWLVTGPTGQGLVDGLTGEVARRK